MERARDTAGLSREFIIHPGETLEEVLDDRNMSQRELAIRTGMTEKHVSTVIHGQKGISSTFAKRLEYALGIEASFWMNLQANYDREVYEFEELNNISEAEIGILRNLKDVIECWSSYGWVDMNTPSPSLIIELRRILGISDLRNIPQIGYTAAYRAQIKNVSVDPYVLFAWQRMCELLVRDMDVADEVDTERLRARIPDIKRAMFLEGDRVKEALTRIFADCGIAFNIVPNFKGAPVQGFIKRMEDGALILCMTVRQKYADIFWFTLFHEIAHILNGDTRNYFVDLDSVSDEIESKADAMARELLINSEDYQTFVNSHEYMTPTGIADFAASQGVKQYIVEGRLMKEELIPWAPREKCSWTRVMV